MEEGMPEYTFMCLNKRDKRSICSLKKRIVEVIGYEN
jgi:hypothetical protein